VDRIFGGESAEYVRTELVIFIRPTVLKTPDEAHALSEEKIKSIQEGSAVMEYIEKGTLNGLYMEGSKFEKEEPKESKPFIKINWPNF
jgi:hypothetical protein